MMRISFVFLLKVTVLGLLAAIAGGAEQLSLPTSRVDFPRYSATPSKFSGGVMISYHFETHYSNLRNNLFVHNRQGVVHASYSVFPPDVWKFHIRDVAASDDGSVAVVGIAWNNHGGISGYLAIVSLDTADIKMVQTAPFEGRTLTYAPDGTLWILGWELGQERRLSRTLPHSALRRFTGQGELISQHLPWPETQCWIHPSRGGPSLAASADRIGVMLEECNRWMEFSLEGELLGQWQWQVEGYENAIEATFTPFHAVMTEEGNVYCDIHINVSIDDRLVTNWALYSLNRKKSIWELVDTQNAAAALGWVGVLAGIDGESLVMVASPGNTYAWANVLKD